jgi:DNA-binding HxlR family transcriptional regulator
VKHYDQYCPMAHALSLVGERWSLLIVRDLIRGPKRYTDLAQGLPGIGTNILASRLKELEGAGIVEKKRLPPPFASTVYELTEFGRGLEEPLYALARWGARSLGPPSPDEELYEGWGVNALGVLFNAQAARGLNETYVFDVDGDVFSARVEEGELEPVLGPVANADLRVQMDKCTFYDVAVGKLEPAAAVASGRARVVEGDLTALERCFSVLSLAPRVGAAAA